VNRVRAAATRNPKIGSATLGPLGILEALSAPTERRLGRYSGIMSREVSNPRQPVTSPPSAISMLFKTFSAAVYGIDAYLMDVATIGISTLTTPRGLPKFAEVTQDIEHCGLDCGLESSLGSERSAGSDFPQVSGSSGRNAQQPGSRSRSRLGWARHRFCRLGTEMIAPQVRRDIPTPKS
jgi:hypothetical protein